MCSRTQDLQLVQSIGKLQKINFRENEKFPKYNLYAYSEGRLTETVRNMKFNGAPVLFVHGNRGSYKQARSYASVALRKGIDNNWTKHLDYFTGKCALHTASLNRNELCFSFS